MAKAKSTYVCQNCGAIAPRWAGRCDACGQWNTIVEENPEQPLAVAGGVQLPKGKSRRLEPLAGESAPPPRIATGISELDRVTGGGFVPGSALLIGGDPGIGKSTLMLQVLAALARAGRRAVYVSGEEGLDQIRLRAQRLGVLDAPLMLASETNVSDIVATLRREKPEVVVIDSLQTLWTPVVEAAPGTVSQLRAGAEAMVRLAKKTGAVMLLIGHVTKEGQIAGPRVVEHMVDAVLYFEGDRGHQYRILRAVKNRFGATDEIGVFEMAGHGLVEVPNPSRLFMGDAESQVPGAAVFAGVEGQRPLLVELQALAVPTTFATPRRAVVGWDAGRLAMILAVLEARAGVRLRGKLKLGTGDEDKGLGTGSTDFTASVEGFKASGAWTLFGSLGHRWMGDSDVYDLQNAWLATLGAQNKLSARTSAGASVYLRQKISRTGSPRRELSGFLTHRLRGRRPLGVSAPSTAQKGSTSNAGLAPLRRGGASRLSPPARP